MKRYLSLILLNYFRVLAKLQLLKNRSATIVGITGSAGKSSTLSACEATLKDYLTVKTNNGYNSETGIPFSILGIKAKSYSPVDWIKYIVLAPIRLIANWEKFDVLLLEMGIDGPDEPKNMSYLLKIVKPNIGIFLNVNLVHSLQFDHTVDIQQSNRQQIILENIGKEKSKLINSLPANGYALLNTNDPIVSQTTQICLAKKIFLKPIPISFVNYAPPQSFNVSISAAINLAQIFNIPKDKATESLKRNLALPPSRSNIFDGINQSTIIDSSYNSSPLACKEMLDVLSKYPSPRIAILGDMRELGQQSQKSHQDIYKTALKSTDTIISVGLETQKYFGSKAIKFTYWWEALEFLKNNLPKKSTILIKGSQNTIFLEEITKALVSENYKALICRQSPYWLKLKEEFRESNS